jgi:LuxR family maltose regulon positive regulatory protein
MPEVLAARVVVLLHQGNLAQAEDLAETHDLPLSAARVSLAQGDAATALMILGPLRQQLEARGWVDELLHVDVVQALAHQAQGNLDTAVQLLEDLLARTEQSGFTRLFVDAGDPMERLLATALTRNIRPGYTARLLAAFAAAETVAEPVSVPSPALLAAQPLIDPLTPRELEVLRLIADGCSNHEISERLFLALSTVKGHNRVIFGKLDVQRRTEAVARARELALI